jgi:ferredoxin-NADP reductase/ferredoxin
MDASRRLLLRGKVYECRAGETVLDALLRQHVEVSYACRQQICLSCVMRSLNGAPPPASQVNLKESLRLQNSFLACGCYPERDMEIALPQESIIQVSGEVVGRNRLNPYTLEVVLQCNTPLDYHAGQTVFLMNAERVGKRLPIASPTSVKATGRYEVHVQRILGSHFSEWAHDRLRVGDKMTLCGVDGELFYIVGQPRKPLLLAGWNDGLGALMGILQDAFENDHAGPVYLFHGANCRDYLYFVDELADVDRHYPNFHYVACVEQGPVPGGCHSGTVAAAAKELLPKLTGWSIYLCGPGEPVHQMQRQAYLAGAAMNEIYREITEIL